MFAMNSTFSWQNSVSLWPASYCTPRPNLTVNPVIPWLLTFAFHPLWWKGHFFFLALVPKGVVDHHRSGQLQLLWRRSWGIDLDYCDNEWFALETKRSFCHSWDCTQSQNPNSFAGYESYSISSKGFFPTVVDIMVFWIKFTLSPPF